MTANSVPELRALKPVAHLISVFFLCLQLHGSVLVFSRMEAYKRELSLKRMNSPQFRLGLGSRNTFPQLAQLMHIAECGVPVRADGNEGLASSLRYANHGSSSAEL